MNLIRAFIAIPIPSALQTAIQQGTAPLRQAVSGKLVRWVPTQNMHLTLKFLGDTAPADVEKLKDALKRELENQPDFEIAVKGLGAFPNITHPRVIWLGMEDKDRLSALHRCAEAAARQIGGEADKNKFSAHLTLGRVRRQARKAGRDQIYQAILAHQTVDLGSFWAREVHLYQSTLKSTGAVYRSLLSVQLSQSL